MEENKTEEQAMEEHIFDRAEKKGTTYNSILIEDMKKEIDAKEHDERIKSKLGLTDEELKEKRDKGLRDLASNLHNRAR